MSKEYPREFNFKELARALKEKYDRDGYMPDANDTIWIDRNGVAHDIETMDIDYAEACIRFLHKKGFAVNVIPKALFKRFNQRHAVRANDFDILD